jgi:DNA-directed RNA polymerase specialized sigma24 family protein
VPNEDGSTPVSPEPENPAVVDHDLLAQTLEREAARVFEYCRALVGREDVAASVTEAALNSARSMLRDPDRLRAWLADLARRQGLASDSSDAASQRSAPPAELSGLVIADSAAITNDPGAAASILLPASHEVFELVYRHGVRREDVGAVLGVSAEQASALLALAERELGRLEPPAAPDPAESAPGPVDPVTGQPMLPAPDRLRAWLFALARQEALAVDSARTARRAVPGTELARYTRGSVATSTGHELLPASWWNGTVAQPTTGRRVRIAALAAVPLAAAIVFAVYLGVGSRQVGSAAVGAGSAATGAAGIPALVLPNASLAAAAPHASPSPTVPIWALFPASPSPVVQPPPPSPPTSPSPSPKPTPKPSASATPKPSASATPKPSASATPKPSASATPKPSASATPKPSASATPKPSASKSTSG